RAIHDRRGADPVARDSAEGARASPARPLRQRREAYPRHVLRAPGRAGGAVLMTFDVVCTGPVFLDLTFEGLDVLPSPGRERYASEPHGRPGGAAIPATGPARLGPGVAVAATMGRDVAGTPVSRLLEAEGVSCVG